MNKNSQKNVQGGFGPVSGGIDCYPDRPNRADCRKFMTGYDGCYAWVCGSDNEYQ
ncbi:hypothetical protein J8L88_22515 [Aquimarina sp. MMG015]|uniref:hypothetical protein n=1 Tax=Aquimarina sp. MMG015 TaxID=2822689 RepID=UPI001B3A3592|nr:hypothetical protein [Aquimarina sp. MMG015]MBQ4805654.1 hypothetical protein [Aquimarina sp. MMG015]